MSKFVGKFRHRDYFLEDDEQEESRIYIKSKKRKSENAELKRMRMQDESYGYDDHGHKKPRKFAKL